MMPGAAFIVDGQSGEQPRICRGGAATRKTLQTDLSLLANRLLPNAFMG